MHKLFQRPLPEGWIYPCTLEEIESRLVELSRDDLSGLWAVGLVPSTQKSQSANARYIPSPKPVIHIMSHEISLTYKLPPHIKRHEIETGLVMEQRFGMQIERQNNRWLCRWEKEDLKWFILDYVLLHEIGHHIHNQQRISKGLESYPSHPYREQFADAYALQHMSNRR